MNDRLAIKLACLQGLLAHYGVYGATESMVESAERFADVLIQRDGDIERAALTKATAPTTEADLKNAEERLIQFAAAQQAETTRQLLAEKAAATKTADEKKPA